MSHILFSYRTYSYRTYSYRTYSYRACNRHSHTCMSYSDVLQPKSWVKILICLPTHLPFAQHWIVLWQRAKLFLPLFPKRPKIGEYPYEEGPHSVYLWIPLWVSPYGYLLILGHFRKSGNINFARCHNTIQWLNFNLATKMLKMLSLFLIFFT